MEIVELFGMGIALLAGVVLVAVLWVFVWQLFKLSRISRAARLLARKEKAAADLEAEIRDNLLSQGFSASEANAALRDTKAPAPASKKP